MPTRVCRTCGEKKDESNFHRNKHRKSGRLSDCKDCVRLKVLESRKYGGMLFTCTACGSKYTRKGRCGSKSLCHNCGEAGMLCGRCKEVKPNDQFHARTAGRGGRYCKPCIQAYNRERNYGLAPGTAQVVLAEFGNVCGICGATDKCVSSPKGALHVDHCHRTGSIRGLLCGFCNSGLGYFRDDPALLSAAIDYLERCRQLSLDELTA